MHPPRSSSFKRGREEEEEEKTTEKEKWAGRSMAMKDVDKTKSQSVPASQAKIEATTSKIKESSPFLLHLLAFCSLPYPSAPKHPKKKNTFLQREKNSQIDRKDLERNISTQKMFLLEPLFKLASVDGKSGEDPHNFRKCPGLIRGEI